MSSDKFTQVDDWKLALSEYVKVLANKEGKPFIGSNGDRVEWQWDRATYRGYVLDDVKSLPQRRPGEKFLHPPDGLSLSEVEEEIQAVIDYYLPGECKDRAYEAGQDDTTAASNTQNDSAQADDADEEPEPPERLSDIALSNEFVRRGGDDFRYVDQLSRWYKYHPAGGRWVEDRKLRIYTDVKRFLTRVSHEVKDAMEEAAAAAEKDGQPAEAEKIRKAAHATCKVLTSAPKVHAVMTLTRSHARVAMLPEQFDKDVFLLNTPAGVVDLKTGKPRPARRDDYFTKTTPVAPRDEPTPVFDEFMRDIMGWHIKPADCKCAACTASVGQPDEVRQALHEEEVDRLVAYQLRVYGYSLTGDVSEQKLFLQVGPGGNGKGTLNDFMRNHIHGRQPDGYATEIPIEALLESRNERHPTDLMSLWHARLAFARESDETSRWNENRVKRLTGGDPIKARYMRQDFIEFDATHKMIVFVNVEPVLRGADEAAWKRRLELTRFLQVYADEANNNKGIRKRDRQLGEKLEKEAAGVLFKLTQACAKWYQQRTLDPPATVLNASDEYLHSQSSMRAFLDETCTRDANVCISANALYPVYVHWCEKAHEWPVKRTKFNAALERAGVRVERTKTERGLCWGLQLKPEFIAPPGPEPPDTKVTIN